ncbi:hypothetical protein HELRODRAFT_178124 [Helobdella robusta]|uniref:Endonuclease/exonuclease/phosphatase domain-containing protein n=1 Tax=Helobdella robusta TaxID=6412 RepID=T1FCS4_HELRO|nr:hypothetical protein HELRODRAFT_178124 [Helobdella robusta]ESN97338.1 hypothetical protein HELRODRAFT_178124 [Helobdella robusta]
MALEQWLLRGGNDRSDEKTSRIRGFNKTTSTFLFNSPKIIRNINNNDVNVNATNFRTNKILKSSSPPNEILKIMQFNCNGIRKRRKELEHHLISNNIQIAAIQETKLSSPLKNIEFSNYTVYRRDRSGKKGGGLLMLIINSIQYDKKPLPSPNNDVIEQQGITIKVNNTMINIINIYIPPQSKCPKMFKASLSHLLSIPNLILLGDFNAHHQLWHSSLQNDRGNKLASEIDCSSCATLNMNSSTYLHTNGKLSSPDISITSYSLKNKMEWSTKRDLTSDHFPIHITFLTTCKATKTSRIPNIPKHSKANWNKYKIETKNKKKKKKKKRRRKKNVDITHRNSNPYNLKVGELVVGNRRPIKRRLFVLYTGFWFDKVLQVND